MIFVFRYLVLFSFLSLLTTGYCFAKLSLKSLAISKEVGLSMRPSFKGHKKPSRGPASIPKKAPVSRTRKIGLTVYAACTRANGLPVLYKEKGYNDCVTESSNAKKIIFDGPTKSLYMGIYLNP